MVALPVFHLVSELARLFSSLITEQGRDGRHNMSEEKQTECWSCAWSHDGHFYAWSCGQRKVKIVPVSLLHNDRYPSRPHSQAFMCLTASHCPVSLS